MKSNNNGQLKKKPWSRGRPVETTTLYCSAEWHLVRMGSELACAIYSLALRLSQETGRFSVSIPTLAAYFGVDERAVRKAIQTLVAEGFFTELTAEPGKSKTYQAASHKDWAESHPAKCAEKLDFPWSKGDPLGRALYAACDGRTKFFYPNVLAGMRKIGHSDEQIVAHWKAFLLADKPEGERWKRVIKRFMEYLREQLVHPQELEVGVAS